MFTPIVPEALTLAVWMPGGWEWIIILAIGLLLFGKRLPEVGRSLGRGIVEFKKGIKGIEDEVNEATYEAPRPKPRLSEQAPTPQPQPRRESAPAAHHTAEEGLD
jgi:sec-independent protein translocase protein TatA